MINYGCTYPIGTKVRVKHGAYKGTVGRVVAYRNYINNGLFSDAEARGIDAPKGMYEVRVAWWHLNNLYCNEIDLEETK